MPNALVTAKADPQLVNTTSLRLLKLLRWLMVSPCSLATLQHYFLDDVDTQKKLSEDTIGLYLNTLRQLGCHIERPLKRNNHCYTLVSHPFKPVLDATQQKAVAQLKQQTHPHLPPMAILTLDDALATLLGDDAMQAIFTHSRTLDYRPYKGLIGELFALVGQGWITVSYQSPKQGLTRFDFAVDDVVYDKGVLYACGKRNDKAGVSRLRVERIHSVESALQSSPSSPLKQPSQYQPDSIHASQWVACYLSVEASSGGEWGVLSNQHWQSSLALWQDCLSGEATIKPIAPGWVLWSAPVSDMFVLRQHLLQWPGAVQVLSPATFVLEWQQELEAMAALYGVVGSQPHMPTTTKHLMAQPISSAPSSESFLLG